MRLLLFVMLVGHAASAQNFVDETDARFPKTNPSEYTNDVSLADINNDGHLDIFFANGNGYVVPVSAEQSRLYLNDGKGKFTDVTASHLNLPEAYVRDGDFADVNNDKWPDLVLSGAFGDPPRLLINQGDGTFKNETIERFPAHDGWWGSSVALGDVDMDGDLDIYLTNSGPKLFAAPGGQDKLYINDGKGFYTDETKERLPKLKTRASLYVEFADIDNDADLDIVVGNREVKNTLLINGGNGVFFDESVLMETDGKLSHEAEVADFDGDGWLDIFVVNGDGKNTRREMLLFNTVEGGQGFQNVTSLMLPDASNPDVDDSECELFDFDHDGDLDVVLAGLSPGAQRLLINDGKGGLVAAPDNTFGGSKFTTLDIEIGDLNGDGRADIVMGQGESGQFANRVLMGKGAVDNRPPIIENIMVPGKTVPFIGPIPLSARIRDSHGSDTGPRLSQVTVGNGSMRWAGGSLFLAEVGTGLITQPIQVTITAKDVHNNSATSEPVTLVPRHPFDVFFDGKPDDIDLNLVIDHLIGKGGLGEEGDMNSDGSVTLADAQLIAAGLGGAPTLTKISALSATSFLLIGANFGAKPTVMRGGKSAKVVKSGDFSMLCTVDADSAGAFVVTVDGKMSNELEVVP